MGRTALRASGTLYRLDEIREENEARRKRSARRDRLFKLVEVVAWILALFWTALLLGSLLRHGRR
jgi:hypothetical protein